MSSLDQFTRELDKSPLTIQAYRADVQQFIQWIAENDFTVTGAHQVERAHITEYLKYLANNKGHTGATRARKLVSLQVFFSYLVKAGVIPHSPAATIDRPRKEQKTMHYLRPDEYSRVLAEAAGDPRDYSIFQVFLHTGIRVSELVALLLSDLDLEQKTVIIHGKGNRERVIPLEKKPFQALKLYLDHRPKNTDLRWVISTTSWVDCSILPPMKSLAYVMPLVEGRYVQRFATYCGPNNLLFDKFAAETP